MMTPADRIRDRARELGFELVGITPASPVPDYDFFRWWLDQDYGATMEYLKRGKDRRGDPAKILAGVRSIICCGLNYYQEGPADPPVARYAWGDDYHHVFGRKLKELADFITRKIDPEAKTRPLVDTGPFLERSYAAQAGLGWIGKNSCLVNRGVGSFVFLGEILTTIAFEEYDRPALDQCGTCTRCLDACPTAAIVEPGVIDSNRCIAYLTIEHRGEFSEDESRRIGHHLYGCDVCQEVCPYNERIPASPLPEFRPQKNLLNLREKSAMERITPLQWERNSRAVAKNLREDSLGNKSLNPSPIQIAIDMK